MGTFYNHLKMPKKQGKYIKSPKIYCSISMLNCWDKVFEKVILNRMIELTGNNRILKDEQLEFRREHSTIRHMKRILIL